MKEPDGEHRQKQQHVRVSDADDAKACDSEEAGQRVARVTPPFVAQHGMVAAEDVHRRDVDQHVTAGADEAEHLGDGRVLVAFVERIKDVEGRHQVEGLAREGNGGCRRAYEAPAAKLTAGL